jgi:hypothetical protein
MKNVFITYSNFRSFLYEFEPRKKGKNKYHFDEFHIDCLSEKDISLLEVARDFLANPEELLTHKYVRVERIDDYEFVVAPKNPAYHLKRNCSLLKSNFQEYMIPDVVSHKGYFEIKKYRFWHKKNKLFARYNFEKFKEKHKVVWGSELRIWNIPNSGNMAFFNMTINELEEVVKFKIDEIMKFKSENPNKWAEIQSNSYSVTPHGSVAPHGAVNRNRDLLGFNKKFKNPLISTLLHYYRAKLNPDLDFNVDILNQLGFKLCKSCNSKKYPADDKVYNTTVIHKEKSKKRIKLPSSSIVNSAEKKQSKKINCTLTFEQQEIFYRKVFKDLSVIVSDSKDFDIKNYILDFYNLVNDKTNDISLALSYAQLLPENIISVIGDDKNIGKYLRSKGIDFNDVYDLRDRFEDIAAVEKYLAVIELSSERLEQVRKKAGVVSSQLEQAFQTDENPDFKAHFSNLDFDIAYSTDNFHFPPIDYRYWLSQHGDNDVGNIRLGLTSRLSNLKMINSTISQDVIELKSMFEAVNYIEKKVASETKSYQDYLDIFDAINNWGGKAIQRGIIYSGLTLRNKLDHEDWFANYIKAANLLRQEDRVLEGIELMFSTPGLGVSFGSKHIAFWTYDNPVTAVYDSKISQILLRSENPKIKDMIPFISAINKLANEQSDYCDRLKPKEIEKALFAFHKHYWSNGSKWLGLKGGIDFDCAVKWNKKMVF